MARETPDEVMAWPPGREFTLVADGAYACEETSLDGFARAVRFVGRMRGGAAVCDPRVPVRKKGKRGPEPTKGPRLPSPRDAARKAGRKRTQSGDRLWRAVTVTIHGEAREPSALNCRAVWPRGLGLRPIQIAVARDASGRMDDVYLFATDLGASLEWVITRFPWRCCPAPANR